MSHSHHPHYVHPRVLKINVGFVLAEGPGFQRIMDLDIPLIRLEDDTELEYLRGPLKLSRNSRGILVQGTIETSVVTECARCLEDTPVPVTLELEELFSYPPTSATAYSVDDTAILDLAPLIREEAILALPMGALCRPDCAGLCPECGQNLNEGTCDCEQNDLDSHFAALRTQDED